MIGPLISLVTGLGVPLRWAKPVLGIIAALALIGAFLGLKSCYDHGIIDKHEAKQEAATAKADRKADTKAAEQRRADDARLTEEAQQLKEAQANAKTNHDRSLARARCIRLQQSARAAKRQPPGCTGPGVPSGAAGTH